MPNTKENFFALVRAAMGEGGFDVAALSESLQNPENLAKVCSLAELHDMVHFVAEGLKKLGIITENQRLSDAITKEELKAIFRVDRLDAELDSVCRLFDENKISHIPLKGSVIRDLYPERHLRMSCDIDILVKEEACGGAVALLVEKLNYTVDKKSNRDVSLFTPSGVHLELHFRLDDEEYLPNLTALAWETAEKGTDAEYRYFLSPETFAFYHIAHAAKHLKHGGCGVKAVLDVFVMSKHPEFIFGSQNRFLKETGLVKFSDAVTELASAWFGNGKHSEITEALERYVLMGGAYGTLDNAITVEYTKRKGKFAYVLSRIFLSPRKLKEQYPSLQKHPWLYPVYQVRRWFALLFKGGTKRFAKEMKVSDSIKESEVDRTTKLLTSLGLEP